MATEIPQSPFPGAVPTLNGRGFMLEALDPIAEAFVACAADGPGEVLDIGCAYGVASLAALAAGAQVCACDMEPRHLDVLTASVPVEQAARLRTVTGVLPDVSFPPLSFRAILASRVVHFLTGDDFRKTLAAMFDWLQPDGRLFLVANTPFTPGWTDNLPAYEAGKVNGEPWPGFIADFAKYARAKSASGDAPPFVNALDTEILERECAGAGFLVEKTSYFGISRLGAESDGRELAGCIARKPA